MECEQARGHHYIEGQLPSYDRLSSYAEDMAEGSNCGKMGNKELDPDFFRAPSGLQWTEDWFCRIQHVRDQIDVSVEQRSSISAVSRDVIYPRTTSSDAGHLILEGGRVILELSLIDCLISSR